MQQHTIRCSVSNVQARGILRANAVSDETHYETTREVSNVQELARGITVHRLTLGAKIQYQGIANWTTAKDVQKYRYNNTSLPQFL